MKNRLSSESPVQKQSRIREIQSSDKTSEQNTSEAVTPNISQVSKMYVSKSLTPKSQSYKGNPVFFEEKVMNKNHETEASDTSINKKCLTKREKCSSLAVMKESIY
ncbi:hypothetical protein OTU49_005376 [Cherax quadricarinatus]|uniref:Uncharacterized protein n=1 Tax=Cherax quadricarinatus TaxID=27406 RepID=A0AAW0YLP8_CHEQU